MKKIIKCFIFVLTILTIVSFFMPCLNTNNLKANTVNKSFEITNYNINIIVQENNVLQIEENITAFFHYTQHGIVRDLPIFNTVVREDGSTETNMAIISKLKVNQKYTSTIINSQFKRLKIGEENKFVVGEQKYNISYNYDLGKDRNNNFDELYFNIIGTGWDTSIDNVSFNIKMPKNFDISQIGFSAGSFGSGGTQDVIYTVTDNVISGIYTKKLNAFEGLTIRCTLPEGYFVGAGNFINTLNIIAVIVLFAFSLISIILLILYHKHAKHSVVETVEFYPPKNLNSAQIGAIYNGKCKQKDILALIFELASLGNIKIHEVKHPYNTEKPYYIFEQVKPYTGIDKSLKNISTELFKSANTGKQYLQQYTFSNSTNLDEVSKNKCVLMDDLDYDFSKAISLEEKSINTSTKNNYISKNNIKIKILLFIMAITTLFISSYPMLLIGGPIFLLIFIFPVVGFIFAIFVKSVPTLFRLIFFGMFAIMPMLAIFTTFISIVSTFNSVLYILGSCASIFILIICSEIIIRNKAGKHILGKIYGFRNFLITAEKERIELLAVENHSYFYNILPYAYVLGVSDKFIEKFEDIITPEDTYLYSTTSISNKHFMDSCLNSLSSHHSSVVRAHASSTSGHGGFSGGGSSGGGSGGGGGSSW